MFKVIEAFADLMDGGFVYGVGDEYPRPGKEVSRERLEELSSDRNRRGVVLIAEEGLSEAKEDAKETDTGVDPSEEPEVKERPKRGRKK